MLNDKITIKLLHPTDSEYSLTAAVSPDATPAYLIQQMVQADFIEPVNGAVRYTLSNFQTGQNLLDNVGLHSAGVADGATIAVHHSTSGADGTNGASDAGPSGWR
jgi:hypothetical protein